MNENWTLIFVALISGAAGVITVFLRGLRGVVSSYLKRWQDSVLRAGYQKGLTLLVEFSEILEELKSLAYVDRIWICIGQNGGGLPKPGEPYTVRAQFAWLRDEKTGGGTNMLRKLFMDLMIDIAYCQILLEMIKHGKETKLTTEMPENSMLRAMLAEDRVEESSHYLLHCDGSRMVFASIGGWKGFTVEQHVRVEMAIQRLRAVMSKT